MQSENIKTYFPKHLSKLREAVPPRVIYYIDSQNYLRFGSLKTKGVLFTYKNPRARNVYFVCDNNKFKKEQMVRNEKGVWYYILPPEKYSDITPGVRLRYKYFVDGLFEHDISNSQFESDGANTFISYFYYTEDNVRPSEGAMIINSSVNYAKTVLFRLYAPSASNVSLLGSFNGWNPEMDVLRKTENGYFEIKKNLAAGEYIYLYQIDGEIKLDKANNDLRSHEVYGRVTYVNVR
ncbi:MAG: hypothetical protein OEZ13_12535 [Spirochaetia bacterium]|nr:hypothetical protein [Spirochaetia bacterium]